MNKLRNLTYIILLIGVSTAVQGQTKKWTLKECVELALENNISIKQSMNTLKSNEQDIKAAKGEFLPSFGANLSQSANFGSAELFSGNFVDRRFYSTNGSLSLNQTIFNGFRTLNTYKQSQLNFERNEIELRRLQDDVSLNVASAYLNVLFNMENLETARSQYEFSQKQLEQVQNLVESGVQPVSNVYDAQANLSGDLQSLTVAQNNHKIALLTLAQLIQVPSEGFDVEVIQVEDPSPSIIYDDVKPIVEYALNNRNEIKIANKNLEIADVNIKLSKAGFLPSVSMGYGFNTGANFSNLSEDSSFFQQINDNKGHGLNLNVNIPIFSRFRNQTAFARSKIQKDNVQLELDKAKLDLEANVQRAFTDAQAALRSYQASTASVQARELSFSNAQERYAIGALNSFELEQARLALINAKALSINAKYDFIFKTQVLDFYLGKSIFE
ncbi:MAG: TolC family protein [Bacteroidetes bacterium]|jgi:outer membrane protein|nr:TolC family protein [Bacteroidota bacterium]MDA0880236.1 TolC family protein [Bacteroidota bacterium]MDA1115352.1 TolC family protein [Bacteroidota bacterium]